MPKPIPDIRKRELAQIHIAKAQLGLDDDTYRAMLWTLSRVRSAADLDFAGRKAVLDHLKSRGWKNQAKPNVTSMKQPLIGKIGALLADMKLPWAYADGVSKQMYGQGKLQWCNVQQLRSIVAALAKLQERRKESEAANE